jgi:roadblock/LC7 domain-containing protein
MPSCTLRPPSSASRARNLSPGGWGWTACIADGGRRGVFVETSRAGFNELFDALGV